MAVTRCGAADGDELELELTKQDLLFQRCLRGRLEREARRKQEELERKQADERRRKEALEQAFDNEVDGLLIYLEEGHAVETADAYGSTLLSEAAAGGAHDCAQVLIGNGADPNSPGRNKRTPLWRAANAGYAETVQLLLRSGGDPRTPDDSGVLPYNVANGAQVKMLLECWDVSVTECMRQSFVANQKKLEKERDSKEKKQSEEMKEAFEAAERKVAVAKIEVGRLRKLVADYRQQQVMHAQKGEEAKLKEAADLGERAEGKLQNAMRIHLDLEWQCKRARLKLRDFENKLRRRKRKEGEATVKPDQIILLRDLADVVTKDVGGKRKEDGRWPMVFDPSGHAATFFRYSGAACFEAAELAVFTVSEEYEDRTRLLFALLKHLKYGGQVVIDLGDDLGRMGVAQEAFNTIEHGLFNTICDRSVLYSYLLPRRFLHLVPSEAVDEYCELMFDDELLSKFTLVFVVSAEEPPLEVMERDCHAFHIVKVRDPNAPAVELP